MAPCGHAGEVVIGTYVRCNVGCDSASVAAGGPVRVMNPPRRGTPGHVDGCACRPCQVRRRVCTIVLRSRGGADAAVIPWDGIATVLPWRAVASADVRNWRMLDETGGIVADGAIVDHVWAGREYTTHIDLFINEHVQLRITPVSDDYRDDVNAHVRRAYGSDVDLGPDSLLGQFVDGYVRELQKLADGLQSIIDLQAIK